MEADHEACDADCEALRQEAQVVSVRLVEDVLQQQGVPELHREQLGKKLEFLHWVD